MMSKIRVLLVDDQTLFIESLKTVFETYVEDIEVVGMAIDGRVAIDLTAKFQPDVVLMDVRMPGMDGVESTKIIKERYPKTRVLILTTFDDDAYVFEALRYGAEGYLLKDMPTVELISAVRAIHQGGIPISPKVASKLVKSIIHPRSEANANEEATHNWLTTLNSREREILGLLAKGFDNKIIAQRLFIGEQTVKNYVSVIYSKLGVKDRVRAARKAIEAGLG
jgi:DNA-binding NarL/FixJ family response regulator